jgi:hypothetical protein
MTSTLPQREAVARIKEQIASLIREDASIDIHFDITNADHMADDIMALVATGLFDLETSLPSRFEQLLEERRDLIRKSDLTDPEKYRLVALNRVADAVRGGKVVTEDEVEALMAAPLANQV